MEHEKFKASYSPSVNIGSSSLYICEIEVFTLTYTIEQFKYLIIPTSISYNLKALWIFGYYTQGDPIE
jgi:hypothetical protein